MARRGLHDEGSKLVIERLEGKIRMDEATSRRLFTLLCALHWKGWVQLNPRGRLRSQIHKS